MNAAVARCTGPVLVLVLVGVGWADEPAKAPALLRWKLRVGREFRFERIQDRTFVTRSEEKPPATQTTKRTTHLTWVVDEVTSDGTARITQTIDQIRYHSEGPGGPVDYDSAHTEGLSGPAARLHQSFKVLVGARFSFSLSPRGEVRDLTLSEATRKAIARTLPVIAKSLKDESFRQLIPTQVLPEAAVAPGDTWTETTELIEPLIGTRTLTTTYRLDGPKDRDDNGLQVIDATTAVTLKPPKNPQFRVEIKDLSMHGTVLFDSKSGRLFHREVQETSTTVTTLQGKTVTQEARGTVTTNLLVDSSKLEILHSSQSSLIGERRPRD